MNTLINIHKMKKNIFWKSLFYFLLIDSQEEDNIIDKEKTIYFPINKFTTIC